MRTHIPAGERTDHAPPPAFVDDQEITASRSAPKHTEAVGSIRTTTLAGNWTIEQLFHLVACDVMSGEVANIVIVPLKFYHDAECTDIADEWQAPHGSRLQAHFRQARALGRRWAMFDKRHVSLYSEGEMIQSFKHRGLRRLYERGDRRGFWAVTVRANWRIIFRFEDGHAYDVELVDYH